MRLRHVVVVAALAAGGVVAAVAPAGAAGGNGASACSIAGPDLSPGRLIDAVRIGIGGFGGIGNNGSNPGFAGPGMSADCRPAR